MKSDSGQLFRLAAPACLLACSAALSPTAGAMEVGGLFKLGYDWGGDKLVSATLISGSGTTHEAIYANSGLTLAGGVTLLNDAKNFALDATVGWKSDSIDASNQSFEFKRFPVEVLGFYNLPLQPSGANRMRFGAGLTYHVNPTFKASGTLANGTVDFDDALGYVVQVDAVMGGNRLGGFNFGVRVTNIEYKAGTASIQANGLGVFCGFMF